MPGDEYMDMRGAKAKINIPYGAGAVCFEVDSRRVAGIAAPRGISRGAGSEADTVRRALESPIASPRLRELSRGKRRVLVITSDHTRPLPSSVTLPILLGEIREGAPGAEIRILIATGTHRPMSPAEMRAKFGEALRGGEAFICHDCGGEGLIYRGELPSGAPLRLNPLADWSELTVAEGFVEPHFFAGFSGGGKAVLPGIAGKASILRNHCASLIADPRSRQGVIEGNPIQADIRAAARLAGLAFILNVTLGGGRVSRAFAGDAIAAHGAGCAAAAEAAAADRVEADIAVTSNGGYPLDQNLYQAVKGVSTAEACVRKGGVIIQCAKLGDGCGGERFRGYFAGARSAREVADAIARVPDGETGEDQWQAQILARAMLRASVVVMTGAGNKALVEGMGMIWAGGPSEAMAKAEAIAGAGASVAFVPDGVGVILR